MARRRPLPPARVRRHGVAIRPGGVVRALPLALPLALGLLAGAGAGPALGCSGAPAVLAPDLEAHLGRIVVARVVERNVGPPGPPGITLAVEETLRGAGPDLLTIERPRQAAGVCHDAFTVWRNTRLLVAFDLRPLAGGGPLMPAWTVRRDGTLGGIYDDPPYATLDEARAALAATQPREIRAEVPIETGPVVLTLLAGVGVLAVAAAAGARSRRHPGMPAGVAVRR